MRTLIKNGTIIDPANHIHARNNLLLQDGKVLATVQDEPEADVVLDAVGKYPSVCHQRKRRWRAILFRGLRFVPLLLL